MKGDSGLEGAGDLFLSPFYELISMETATQDDLVTVCPIISDRRPSDAPRGETRALRR